MFWTFITICKFLVTERIVDVYKQACSGKDLAVDVDDVPLRTVNKNEPVADLVAVLFEDQQELYQDLLMEQMEQM